MSASEIELLEREKSCNKVLEFTKYLRVKGWVNVCKVNVGSDWWWKLVAGSGVDSRVWKNNHRD